MQFIEAISYQVFAESESRFSKPRGPTFHVCQIFLGMTAPFSCSGCWYLSSRLYFEAARMGVVKKCVLAKNKNMKRRARYAGKTLRTWLVSLPEKCDAIGERGGIAISRWSLGGGCLGRVRMLGYYNDPGHYGDPTLSKSMRD